MLKKFLYECKRTLQVARKPDRDEFTEISRVTGLGILIIGLLGFLISMGAILILGG